MVIMTKECVDTAMDMSVKKLEILQRKEPIAPWMRNTFCDNPVTVWIIKRGIRKTGKKRSEAAILIMNTFVAFFTEFDLKKTSMRRLFPSRETSAIALYTSILMVDSPSMFTSPMHWEVLFILKCGDLNVQIKMMFEKLFSVFNTGNAFKMLILNLIFDQFKWICENEDQKAIKRPLSSIVFQK